MISTFCIDEEEMVTICLMNPLEQFNLMSGIVSKETMLSFFGLQSIVFVNENHVDKFKYSTYIGKIIMTTGGRRSEDGE